MVLRSRSGTACPARITCADASPGNVLILVVQRARKTCEPATSNRCTRTNANTCAARDGKRGAR